MLEFKLKRFDLYDNKKTILIMAVAIVMLFLILYDFDLSDEIYMSAFIGIVIPSLVICLIVFLKMILFIIQFANMTMKNKDCINCGHKCHCIGKLIETRKKELIIRKEIVGKEIKYDKENVYDHDSDEEYFVHECISFDKSIDAPVYNTVKKTRKIARYKVSIVAREMPIYKDTYIIPVNNANDEKICYICECALCQKILRNKIYQVSYKTLNFLQTFIILLGSMYIAFRYFELS